jgi:hypothetical protein
MLISRRSLIVGSAAFLGSTALSRPVWAVEPFTATWLAAAVLEAGLKWATGTALDAAMGGFTLNDVHTWIRQAVAEIEAFVSAKLDEKVLEQIRSHVEAMRDLMNQYASLKPKKRFAGKFLLKHVDTTSAELLHLTFNYPQAMAIGFVALGYRMLAVTSLYKLERDAGFIVGDKQLIDDCIINYNKMYEGFRKGLSPESRIGRRCWEDDPPGHPGDNGGPEVGSYNCSVALDGVEVGSWDTSYINQEESVRRRADDYIQNKLKPPVLENLHKFEAATLACFHKTIDTYTTMCKLAKITYKSPIEFPAASLTADQPPRTLFMPGAAIIDSD